ncbi:MAG: flagellar basal-body rod protein, partial [Desulfovibrio sp.]|nr:flagellar basal-body rod protein [Desulfovibrio sp.]
MNGINSSMQYGASAMNALGLGMNVVAHNVANVSTAAFVPRRAAYADGVGGQGMQLDAVLRDAGPAADWSAANAVYDVTPNRFAEHLSPSGTELSAEITRMISTQHAYEANA